MVVNSAIRISTRSNVELVDITKGVSKALQDAGITSGIILVYTPHTTSALLVNENERGLVTDLTREVQRLVDWESAYEHNRVDNNAPSHITGAFLGPSVVLPVIDGELNLGTWQSIFFVELDGPRDRRVITIASGE
ncbi:MAG: secondary thiamine-phosphate synthase enzyme YjbQ [Actinobacteria bacterium]|nr:secondary thiamine-phosphate synthase enzyme YjbQ [Actinomycetota bacterium]